MKSFRRLLLKSFENELNEANEYFIGAVSDESFNSDEFLYSLKDKYSLEDIQDFFVGRFPYFVTKEDLFDFSTKFFKNATSKVLGSDGNGLMFIPIFKYLFDNRAYKFDSFCKMYMALHLEDDKFSVYKNGFMDGSKALFSIDLVEKMDAVVYSRDYFCGVNTIAEMLNYIDYENDVNNYDYNREYLDALDGIYERLYNCLVFYTSNKEAYKYPQTLVSNYKFTSNNDNLNLVKFVLGKIPNYKNSFYQLEEIEKLLQLGTVEERKKNLIVAFAYKDYMSSDSFYASFSDVSLTSLDLINFIKEYEKTGKRLSADQFGNILVNFRRKLLDSSLALESDDALTSSVKKLYKKFRKDDYVSTDDDFIEQYRMINSAFSRYDFERIINGNYLYDFTLLSNTRSFKEYCKETGFSIESNEKASKRYKDEAAKRKEIYDKYYEKLVNQQNTVDETMEYFVRNNVDACDLEEFRKLKAWFESSSEFTGWNLNPRVAVRCSQKLLDDFLQELESSPYMDRQDILRNYLKYATNDKVKPYVLPRDFDEVLDGYERRFKISNAWALFGDVCIAMEEKENLGACINELGLSLDDALEIFSLLNNKANPDLKDIISVVCRTLEKDVKVYEEDKKSQKDRELKEEYESLINSYLDTEHMNCKSFFKLFGVRPYIMSRAVNYVAEHNKELYDAYVDRIKTVRAEAFKYEIPHDTVKNIANGIISGVELDDGSRRDFTYLDYVLMTDAPFGEFVTTYLKSFNASDEELEKIREFTFHNGKSRRYKEENLLKNKEEISINGVRQEIDKDTKLKAFEYIDSLELPKEIRIYNIVVRGIADGSLEVGSTDTSSKVFKKESCN